MCPRVWLCNTLSFSFANVPGIIQTSVSVSSPVIGVGRQVKFNRQSVRSPRRDDVPQVLAWQFIAKNSNTVINVQPDGVRVILVENATAISAELTVEQVELSDDGLYRCVAFNEENSAEPIINSVTLSVEGKLLYFTREYIMYVVCLLYTSPSPRDQRGSRMPSSA